MFNEGHLMKIRGRLEEKRVIPLLSPAMSTKATFNILKIARFDYTLFGGFP